MHGVASYWNVGRHSSNFTNLYRHTGLEGELLSLSPFYPNLLFLFCIFCFLPSSVTLLLFTSSKFPEASIFPMMACIVRGCSLFGPVFFFFVSSARSHIFYLSLFTFMSSSEPNHNQLSFLHCALHFFSVSTSAFTYFSFWNYCSLSSWKVWLPICGFMWSWPLLC